MTAKPVVDTPVHGKYRSIQAAQWASFTQELGFTHQAFKVIQRFGARDIWLREPCVTLLAAEHANQVDMESLRLACPWDTIIVGSIPEPMNGTWLWPMVLNDGRDLDSADNLHVVPVSFDVDSSGSPVLRRHPPTHLWTPASYTEPRLDLRSGPHEKVNTALKAARDVGRYWYNPVPDPAKRTLVYLHYDEDRTLLYVGITNDPTTRGGSHSSYATWSQFASTMEGVWLPSRAEAEQRERELIEELAPVFNLAHVDPAVARKRRTAYLRTQGRTDLLDAA